MTEPATDAADLIDAVEADAADLIDAVEADAADLIDAVEAGAAGPVEADAPGAETAGSLEGPEADAPDPGLPGDDLTEAQLEALLFVAERPLTRRELTGITGASEEVVNARLGDLEVTLAGRGVRVVVEGDRVALATAPEAGRLIGRFIGREPTRLSQSVLETLAIVAYRQPVTKSAVERIRGVDAEYALRALLHRRLVVELGRSEAPGRPILYGTGIDFLERFGLTSIEQLPLVDPDVAQRLATPEAAAAEAAAAGSGAGQAGPVRASAAGEPGPGSA